METKIFAKATVWREHAIGTLSNIETYVHSYTCTRERFIKAFSIIDIDAKVRAVMGMFAQGERTQVKISDFGTARITSGSGQYRFISRSVKVAGRNLTHLVILHRSLIDIDVELPAVISDSDIVEDTINKLAKIYAIPNLKAWHLPLFNLLLRNNLIQKMHTWTAPNVEMWKHLKGVTATRELTEETLLDVIKVGIQSGQLIIPEGKEAPDFDPEKYEKLSDYLADYAVHHAKTIEETVRPTHNVDDDVDPRIIDLKRTPFPAQAHAITALYKKFKKGAKSLFAVGDMGTGKSIIALGVMHLMERDSNGLRVLMMVPGITIPKWIKEIKATVPWAKVQVFNSWRDVVHYAQNAKKKPQGLEIYLIGRDRSKLGFDPWICALWKRVKGSTFEYAWHCPDCFGPLPDPKSKKGEEEEFASWSVLAEGYPPEDGKLKATVKWKKHTPHLRSCPHCGAILRRPANKSLGETRMKPRLHPAQLMKKLLPGHFDLFVADECHQLRGDSGQGEAYGQLVCCAKQVLNLTGTLTGGKAGDIYRLLERSDIKPLLEDGFEKGEIAAFVATYGVLQEIRKTDEVDDGVFTTKRKERKQVREIPGLSPSMFVKYLLDRSIFLDLNDLGLPLVEFHEEPVFIELDSTHKAAYDEFHRRLHDVCTAAARAGGNQGAFAKFLPATLNYADRPVAMEVQVGDEVVSTPELPISYSAKERRLVKEVQKELAENRGVIIFCHFTSAYATDSRLQQVLAEHGIESAVLKSSVSTEERMNWLEKQATLGTKVIICNMKLVEVGLDIIDWPTAIFYQGSYDIYTLRQAARRSWRIGQYRECRVKYFIAAGTQQQAQFEKILERRCHALLLEGRLDRSEMAKYIKDDSFSVLTRKISADLSEIDDLSSKWKELAAKDLPDVTTVSEDEFLEAVNKAKKELVALTFKLCNRELTPDEARKSAEGLRVAVMTAITGRRRKKITEGQLAFADFLSEGGVA